MFEIYWIKPRKPTSLSGRVYFVCVCVSVRVCSPVICSRKYWHRFAKYVLMILYDFYFNCIIFNTQNNLTKLRISIEHKMDCVTKIFSKIFSVEKLFKLG